LIRTGYAEAMFNAPVTSLSKKNSGRASARVSDVRSLVSPVPRARQERRFSSQKKRADDGGHQPVGRFTFRAKQEEEETAHATSPRRIGWRRRPGSEVQSVLGDAIRASAAKGVTDFDNVRPGPKSHTQRMNRRGTRLSLRVGPKSLGTSQEGSLKTHRTFSTCFRSSKYRPGSAYHARCKRWVALVSRVSIRTCSCQRDRDAERTSPGATAIAT